MASTNSLDIIQRENRDLKRIGIMGGTFDPIHYGHLVIAEQIRCEYRLDKILFIPAGNPPHKLNTDVSSSRHRYFMTLLATVTNPFFEVSKIEMEGEEISYTIHTLTKLKKIFSEDVKLFFITGADAICDIENWKDVEILVTMCDFIAATRPGLESPDLEEKIRQLQCKYNSSIRKIDVPALAISSTDIRCRVREGQSIKYLLPESVEYYIYKHGLYR
ncbi:nicotinate-nucleotide adenylyltransferase [Geosporobacter subterraneus DSM 17957]|uniref:Probable nicotinate-nucleotide adenylyltransferase n=1 Tax=Geosporobacter subterraneus DSM 17957 TaxID=1121919 RepID=A0A1M6BP34_9FIRM|nr:nicotinate-nucleotide adenylyltransferase [Geosporobacter subterraneus]SHI50427.1 nicotinate-nucleotide adenylyltransferase [Geosporobacter subterraneus DSM 17957]